MIKQILHIILIIFIFTVFQTSVIANTENSNDVNTSLLLVNPGDNEAGQFADYILSFQISISEYSQANKGEMIITFPSRFGYDSLNTISVVDDYTQKDFDIRRIVRDEQSISIYVRRVNDTDDDDLYPDDPETPINVQVHLNKIQNPEQIGEYQVSLIGLKDNHKIAFGPFLSDPFEVVAGGIESIVVYPSDNLTLRAGSTQQFLAEALDRHGNVIDGVNFTWELEDCTYCIGELEGSVLLVTRVGEGRVKVSAESVTGFSGTISVIPGELAYMELHLGTTQVVGNPIKGTPIEEVPLLFLYDAYFNLKYDYNLSQKPIYIESSVGELSQYNLNDSETLIDGIMHLDEYKIKYSGYSGNVSFQTTNGFVYSNVINTYFNNYDILDVLNAGGKTITHVYADGQTTVDVVIQNNGNLRVEEEVAVRAYFSSDVMNEASTSFVPSEPGQVDFVELLLPVNPGASSNDELVVITESTFKIDDAFLSAADTQFYQVEIIEGSTISFVEGSFHPDSILNHNPFGISFQIETGNELLDIDSAQVRVALINPDSNIELGVLYRGNPEVTSFIGGIVSYENLDGLLDYSGDAQDGYYAVGLEYHLFSSGTVVAFESSSVDSIYVMFSSGLELVEGSLYPRIVYAGSNVSFEFKVNLRGDVPYMYHMENSVFRLFDYNYSTSTNLFLDTDSLMPGENILRSASISIQPEQVGRDLLAEARFKFCISNMFDTLTFSTGFTSASLPIEVRSLPTVQIIDLEVVSPNAPKVNTNQDIQIGCSLVSLSEDVIDTLLLQLLSVENESVIHEPTRIVRDLQPYDTVQVLFDVTAAAVHNLLPESFRVDVLSETINELPPVNNAAFLFIEEPALLGLNYRVNGIENIEEVIVSQGDQINISFEMNNSGSASVTSGTYQLVIDGIPGLASDTLTGLIPADSNIDFSFIAPRTDTVVTFDFSLTDYPTDININAPAELINESAQFSILTVSAEAELIVDPLVSSSNLVLPGRPKELLELTLSNTGSNSINAIRIESIGFNLFTREYNEVDTRSVIDIGKTGYYENGIKITSATAAGNRLSLWFDGFEIYPQESKTIVFEADFKNSDVQEIILELPRNDVQAVYTDGPNEGNQVLVSSPSGEDVIANVKVVLKGSSLKDSFIMDNNPFNPLVSPVTFSFELADSAPIEFRVFTLTGEEVFSSNYSDGLMLGENMIQWDGRNNNGDMVLNGVYIASILNKSTGEYARIKVAVVK